MSVETRITDFYYDIDTDTFYTHDKHVLAQMLNHPIVCCFHIGYKCNLCCPYCLSPFVDDQLSRADVDAFVRFVKEEGIARVVVSGGEPFLYEQHLSLLVKKLKDAGLITMLSTNGMLINMSNKTHRSIINNIDWFDISLPAATRETYLAVRRHDGFDTVVETIKRLTAINARVRLTFTICKENESEIDEFAVLANELGSKKIRYESTLPLNNLESFSANLRNPVKEVGISDCRMGVLLPMNKEQLKSYIDGYLVARFDGVLFRNSALPQNAIGTFLNKPYYFENNRSLIESQVNLFVEKVS